MSNGTLVMATGGSRQWDVYGGHGQTDDHDGYMRWWPQEGRVWLVHRDSSNGCVSTQGQRGNCAAPPALFLTASPTIESHTKMQSYHMTHMWPRRPCLSLHY
eukprot:365053-Chlamydomonas_euryale.AAC.17